MTEPNTSTEAGASAFRDTLVREDAAAAERGSPMIDADTRAAYDAAVLEHGGKMSADSIAFLMEDPEMAAELAPKAKKAKPAEDVEADEGEPLAEEAAADTEEAPEVEEPEVDTGAEERAALTARVQDLEAKLQERDVATEERYETIWASAEWAIQQAEDLLGRLAALEGWDQDKVDLYRLRAESSLAKAVKEAPGVGSAKKAREAEKAKAAAEGAAKEAKAKSERTAIVKANLAVAMRLAPGVTAATFIQKFFDPRTGVFDVAAAKKAKQLAAPKAKPAAAKKPVAKPGRVIPPGVDPRVIEFLEETGDLDAWLA